MLSWIFLGGKCRYCKAKVSARYFYVELTNGLIWAGIWYEFLIRGADVGIAVAYAAAGSALVAAIFIDLELYLIPDQINAFVLVVGIGYNVWLYAANSPSRTTWGMPSSIAGALVGVVALWLIAILGRILFRKDAMGHGDIKMARGIGAVLFPGLAAMSFALAVVLGAVLGIVQVIAYRPSGGTIHGPGAETSEPVEEEPQPESIGSLLKCGLGYLLCFDVIGLFLPKFYRAWFNEDPFTPVQEMEEFEVEPTMIPFGPYLALGAIAAAIFQGPLLGLWQSYVNSMRGGPALMEHYRLFGGLF